MHAIGAAQYLHAFERLFNAFHPAVLRLLGLALTLVLFCHWLGCGWWLVSEIEGVESCIDGCAAGWGARADVRGPSVSLATKYNHAFFWGAAMATAMLPFDVVPVSDGEIVYTQLAMVRRPSHATHPTPAIRLARSRLSASWGAA